MRPQPLTGCRRVGRGLVAAGTLAALLPACHAGKGDGPDRPPSPIRGREPALSAIALPPWSILEDTARHELPTRERLLAARGADRATRQEDLATAYGELGKAYHAFGLHDSALPCYENAHRLAPGVFAWPYLLARAQSHLGRADAAQANLETALAIQPDSPPALLFLADLHRAAGRMADAGTVYRRLLDSQPGFVPARYGLGQLALLEGDHAGAIENFEQVLRDQPQGAGRVHYQLALAYRQAGDLEKSRLHLARRGQGAPTSASDLVMEDVARINPRTVARRGAAALRAGNPDQAAENLQEAVEAAPDDVDLRLQLGVALSAAGRPEQAVAPLRAGLRLKPTDPRLHYHLGAALTAQGRHEEAVASMRRAVELHPGYAEAQLGLGQVLRRVGRPAEARGPVEAAVRADPSSVPARLARARLLAQLGECREAVEGAERALALLPDSPPLGPLLASLLAACPDPRVRDGDRALRLAKQAFAAADTAEHAGLVALAHASRGDWSQAETWQRRAIAMLPAGRAPVLRAALEERLGAYRQRRMPPVTW